MSRFPNKVSVPAAVKERNNFPLDCAHQTTTDFGLTSIAYMQPIVPTDKVKLSISSFAYLQSLLAPNMGAADLVQRAFFVPYDFICADWKSFISGKANNQDSTTIPALPMFSRQIITNIFLDIFSGAFGYETSSLGALHSDDLIHWITDIDDMKTSDISAKMQMSDLYDYWFSPAGTSPATGYDYVRYNVPFSSDSPTAVYDIYFRFKPQGKVFYNLLIQCGYSVELGNLYSTVSDDENLLALFSVLKVYIDYYVDPRYNWVDFSSFFREFTNDPNGFGSLSRSDQTLLIHDILVLISYCWFGNDLFTSSWQSHEQPALNGLFKSITLAADYTEEGVTGRYVVEKSSTAENDARIKRSNNSSLYQITDTMLSMLKAVSSYFKRNAIAGTRPIDILYARFGAHMPEIVAQRAQYLGSHRVPVKITDIMANAAGTDASGNSSILGERAGQGIVAGKPFNINFESKYFYGYLIVISHLVPRTMYYQGVKPWNLCKTQFDFFTPEMEDIGAEPIPNSVLYSDQQTPSQTFEFNRSGIFGYAPRYYQYKFGFDTLSGDFRLKRYYNSMRPYTMFRELTDIDDPQASDLVNNSVFRQFSQKSQAVYDKMFVSQDIIDNHFVVSYLISVNANRPMRGIGISLLGKIEGGKNSVGLRPNGKYL